MQGISPIFPVQKVEETDSLQSSFPLSASISQQVNYYGPPSHSSFPQPAFPHHSQNFQSTSLHPSLASQSTNLHSSLASSSVSTLPQASDLPSLKSTDFQTEVVASGSAPRKRGRPRKHVDPCQGGHTFTLLDVDIVYFYHYSWLLVQGSIVRTRVKVRPPQCPHCRREPGHSTQHRHACHHAGCGRTFTKRNHLEAHLLNHAGARPFLCSQPGCAASFVR